MSEARRRWYARGEGRDVLSIVLAGGEGRRLYPLTKDRCKPAVPFGGRYRIVDFVLSNLVNSGIFRNVLLTQFKSQSLTRHVERAWQMSSLAGHFIEPVPAQMRMGPHWYKGNADAIFQNLDIIAPERGDIVLVFGADHIYKMDVNQMIAHHVESGAECTIAAIPAPIKDATQYGVMAVGDKSRIARFDEKPANPAPMPGDPTRALCSMGNYVFNRKALFDAVTADAESQSAHDLGRDIVPAFVRSGTAYAYNFEENRVPGAPEESEPYWRDVGTLDAYWEANMDLVSVTPRFDLYNPDWPIMSLYRHVGPAKFVFSDRERSRVGLATDSLVCEGCIISGGRVDRSVLGPWVRINSYADVEESILFEGVEVGRRAQLRRVIADKGVSIPPDAVVGYDAEEDRKRFTVTDSGIVVLEKGAAF